MLFHEKRPELQRHLASGGCAASDNRSTTREAIETFEQHLAADVFDDDVHSAFVGNLACLVWPIRLCRVENEFRAEMSGQCALGFRAAGADDACAKLPGDLNGGRADSAR